MAIEAFSKAISMVGSQTALANRIGKKQSHIWTWLNRDKRVPAESVLAVAEAVGFEVTPHQLRPDIYPNPDDGLPEDMRGREVA